jgi:hypothetical protein
MGIVHFVTNPSQGQQEHGPGQHTQILSSYLSTEIVDNSLAFRDA